MSANWDRRFQEWARKRIKPRDQVTLNRKIIYILPSTNGLLVLVAAGLIFIAAINYAVSLAFGLAFTMVSVFILAIFYTYNNLNQLSLSSLPTLPVFAGDEVVFRVQASRASGRRYEALEFNFPGDTVTAADLIDNDQEEVRVFTQADRRGYFRAPLLRITTFFPLGLARAWSVVDLKLHCLVYPKPVPFVMEQFSRGGSGSDDSAISKDGSEDFYGLREYVPGDPLRQVAWKNVARGQGMQVKQFVDYVDNRIWLDWDMFYGFGTEERLSRLCYGVLKLAKSGQSYGLKLPGFEIAPASGAAHKQKLLRTLALFGKADGAGG
ncbi:MAG: DUF58 domain-containing protein [Gammaproteobacteria bacterium]